MEGSTRRRESTLNGFAVTSASAVNLFDMSLGEDVSLEENALNTSQDPDLTIKHPKSQDRNTFSTDLLGDATPLPAKLSRTTLEALPLNPPTLSHHLDLADKEASMELSAKEAHVARLLIAVERLRGERDELRTQLEYLESEKAVEQKTLNGILSRQQEELVSLRDEEQVGPSTLQREQQIRIAKALDVLTIVVKNWESYSRSVAIPDPHRDEVSAGLRNQIKTLEAELKSLQDTLQEVQQDYEGHLWTCSKGAPSTVSESVDSRVEELEGRVARRTERIGILQHDVKRLECNLGLAEEQIAELNTERESLIVDNKCLTEDSATARRERDSARQTIISLEMQIDNLRSETATRLADGQHFETQRECAVSRADALANRCEELEATLRTKEKEFEILLKEKEKELSETNRNCTNARQRADSLAEQLSQLSGDNATRDEEFENVKQDLNTAKESLEFMKRQANQENLGRMEKLEQTRKQEVAASIRMAALAQDCERLQSEISSQASLLERANKDTARVLERERLTAENLTACQASLQDRITESETLQLALNCSQSEFQSSTIAHQSALVSIIEQLFSSISRRRRLGEVLSRCQESLDDAQRGKVTLAKDVQVRSTEAQVLRIETVTARNSLKKQDVLIQALLWKVNDDEFEQHTLADAVNAREVIISQLRVELNAQQNQNAAFADTQSQEIATRIQGAEEKAGHMQSLADERQATIEHLEQQRLNLDAQISAQQSQIVDLEDALRVGKARDQDELTSLQSLLNDSQAHASELEASAQHMQKQLMGFNDVRHDLESAVSLNAKLDEEVLRLKLDATNARTRAASEVQQLQEIIIQLEARVSEGETIREQEKSDHTAKLAIQAEAKEATRKQMDVLQSHRDQIQVELEKHVDEIRGAQTAVRNLQHDYDTLQAEGHSKEMLLESTLNQLRNSSDELKKTLNEVDSLQAQIQKLRKDLSIASQQANAARLEFDLQISRDNQEIATLKKSLGKYQNQPNLREKVEELETRNEELEETLQARCAEIEENDDRFLEVLKEKKKLSAKIESLNRKVYKLQKQLSEVSDEASPTSTGAPSAAPPAHIPSLANPPAKASPRLVFETENISPATLASRTMPAVRSDRTPTKEKRQIQGGDHPHSKPRPIMRPADLQDSPPDLPTSRKRPAPDDFDPVLPRDPQPVVATSPAQGLRKALNGIKSGFTPSRNSLSQSPLKKKSAPSLGISDITNSPRARSTISSTTASRGRSWLGKIRGESDRDSKSISQLFNQPPLERQAPFS